MDTIASTSELCSSQVDNEQYLLENDNREEEENATSEMSSSIHEKKKFKRKNYSLDFKLMVIEYMKKYTRALAVEKFQISRKTALLWSSEMQEEQIRQAKMQGKGKCKRLSGGGRPIKNEKVEELLNTWIIEERAKRKCVTRRMIKEQAVKFSNELKEQQQQLTLTSFFDNSWLNRFCERRSFTLRKRTSICQKTPGDYMEKVKTFVFFIDRLRAENEYELKDIYACDETPIWLESLQNYTVEQRGARDVSVLGVNSKIRFTLVLTARADGSKCKPFLLLNRKRVVKELNEFSDRLELIYLGTSWMNDETTKLFIERIISNGKQVNEKRKLLVWDSFRSHYSAQTKLLCKQYNIDNTIIPGGCTKFIQPADVCWNRPFKTHISQYYSEWSRENSAIQPSLVTLCKWIADAWAQLDTDLIVKSFSICGITNARFDELFYFRENRMLLSSLSIDNVEDEEDEVHENNQRSIIEEEESVRFKNLNDWLNESTILKDKEKMVSNDDDDVIILKEVYKEAQNFLNTTTIFASSVNQVELVKDEVENINFTDNEVCSINGEQHVEVEMFTDGNHKDERKINNQTASSSVNQVELVKDEEENINFTDNEVCSINGEQHVEVEMFTDGNHKDEQEINNHSRENKRKAESLKENKRKKMKTHPVIEEHKFTLRDGKVIEKIFPQRKPLSKRNSNLKKEEEQSIENDRVIMQIVQDVLDETLDKVVSCIGKEKNKENDSFDSCGQIRGERRRSSLRSNIRNQYDEMHCTIELKRVQVPKENLSLFYQCPYCVDFKSKYSSSVYRHIRNQCKKKSKYLKEPLIMIYE